MEQIWFERLSTHSFVSTKENEYFSALNFNGLFRSDRDGANVEMLGEIPEEKRYSRHLYSAMELIDGKIYLAPMNAKDIVVYNIENRTFFKISLKEEYSSIICKFCKMLCDGAFLYLIPFRYPAIVRIDLKDNSIVYLDSWLSKLKTKNSNVFVKNGCFLKNGTIYMALFGESKVLKINTETQECQSLDIPTNKQQGFVDMFYDEENYWFIQRNYTSIVKYYEKSGEIEYVYIDGVEKYQEGMPYIRILDFDEKIFIAAYHGKRSVIIDKKTNLVQDILDMDKFQEPIFKNSWDARFFYAEKIGAEQVLLGNIADHQCLVLNLKKQLIEKNFILRNFRSQQMYNEYFLLESRYRETEEFNFEDFFEHVDSYEDLLKNNPQKSFCGKKIHQVISGLLN